MRTSIYRSRAYLWQQNSLFSHKHIVIAEAFFCGFFFVKGKQ